MTWTGLPQLQAAVFARLRGDAAQLMKLVTGVYDDVPELKPYPYIVFDDPFESPDRTFGQGGHESSFMLTIYTQDGSATKAGTGSAGFKQGMTIADRALALLIDEANPLLVTGHDLRDLDVDHLECVREPDGITRRIDIFFTAFLEDAA
jgi:hypothetical protein